MKVSSGSSVHLNAELEKVAPLSGRRVGGLHLASLGGQPRRLSLHEFGLLQQWT